ncbi:hypothetical protein KEM48_006419 [Puccinia striiformis f. sp. tritici PST-130]|uniref:Uncharacterized protein n=1 Tax=Puccinia striiformis f. sp. tritici PST-78 TaxID=1165861 RepID=A0A0L0V750_9BASI|nr:hypothetical protein Pst134EB_020666 [Puccinia striiformis f. sp. tritici]KAI9619062.1 hypothetical protein KEM48_006419 [Puccinia striiformis f. sp. tritici PST-130]KNE95001.1 hypothetical protein PSTG_11698 [Puccinia striiformis f. sp. tritici PST-78]
MLCNQTAPISQITSTSQTTPTPSNLLHQDNYQKMGDFFTPVQIPLPPLHTPLAPPTLTCLTRQAIYLHAISERYRYATVVPDTVGEAFLAAVKTALKLNAVDAPTGSTAQSANAGVASMAPAAQGDWPSSASNLASSTPAAAGAPQALPAWLSSLTGLAPAGPSNAAPATSRPASTVASAGDGASSTARRTPSLAPPSIAASARGAAPSAGLPTLTPSMRTAVQAIGRRHTETLRPDIDPGAGEVTNNLDALHERVLGLIEEFSSPTTARGTPSLATPSIAASARGAAPSAALHTLTPSMRNAVEAIVRRSTDNLRLDMDLGEDQTTNHLDDIHEHLLGLIEELSTRLAILEGQAGDPLTDLYEDGYRPLNTGRRIRRRL